jgi:putative ABC transport system permease protein
MLDLEKWLEIYATIKKHKLRTALTAFGVFWGIFMLVVLLGAGNGLYNGVTNDFNIAKNAVFLWSQRTSIPYKGYQPGRTITFNNDDIKAIKENIPEVAVVAPQNNLHGEFSITRGTKSASFSVKGDYPEIDQVRPLLFKAGRFINYIDIKEKRKVAVIGDRVREILFESNEDPLGQYISIKGNYFQVVGVTDSNLKGEDRINELQMIYIPHSTLQQTFNQPNIVHYFAFIPKEGIKAEVIETKVKELLAKRHNVAPNDLKAFGSNNIEEEFKKIQGLFFGIAAFSWLVSIGTIIAGVVGVGNIMLIIVKERTKEIGIRKALGAKPWSIISLILQESLVLTGISGYFGLVAGVGLIEAINLLMNKFNLNNKFFSNPEIDFRIAITALVVLVLAGTLAGLIPAIKAAKVDPVVALRDE